MTSTATLAPIAPPQRPLPAVELLTALVESYHAWDAHPTWQGTAGAYTRASVAIAPELGCTHMELGRAIVRGHGGWTGPAIARHRVHGRTAAVMNAVTALRDPAYPHHRSGELRREHALRLDEYWAAR